MEQKYVGVSKSFRTESITKYTLTFDITRWEATQRVMAAKLTRPTHKIAIQMHLVAESSNVCSSRSRQPVRKRLNTPSYVQKFPDWVDTTKYTPTTTINTRWEATQRVMAAKLTRLTHKIAIQLHLVAESRTVCSSHSRWPVRSVLDTPSYTIWNRIFRSWSAEVTNMKETQWYLHEANCKWE
jgi:hypothetical protein